jgi:hypothetical protein
MQRSSPPPTCLRGPALSVLCDTHAGSSASTAAGEETTTTIQFLGGGEREDSSLLDYEGTLEALLSLIGRQVLVLFSGTGGPPFIAGVLTGRLERGEPDERLRELLLRADTFAVETLFFHVGSRQNGFVIRPDEFEQAFWQTDRQLTIHLGRCAITVLIQGELGNALRREQHPAN